MKRAAMRRVSSAVVRVGRWPAFIDVGPPPGEVPGPRPGRPEDQREQDAGGADRHENPADGVDVHRRRAGVDGEREDRADRYEKDSDSDAHQTSLFLPMNP